MGYAYQILPEENLVMNTISGVFTFKDYLALMEAILEDGRFERSMNMFWDFRNSSLKAFSNRDIEGIRNYILANKERRGENYHVAFLVNKSIDYGLSRMYQIISEDLPVTFQVFYDEHKALDWIRGRSAADT